MRAILEFFAAIGDFISGAFQFLLSCVADLVYIVQLTAKAVAAIPSYLRLLPPSVIALLTTIFAVVVLYKIFGREG